MVNRRTQARKVRKFRMAAKTALLRREMTVTDLADRLRIQRSSVSRAINNGVYPRIRARVAEELNLPE